MQTEREMRGRQSERKGRGNKTMIKEKSGESEGQERLHEEK